MSRTVVSFWERSLQAEKPVHANAASLSRSRGSVAVATNFFIFSLFFEKKFTNMPLEVCFQNLDPLLGAIDGGAEVTCLSAIDFGA